MKYGLYTITIATTLLALFGARYGIRAYFQAQQMQTKVEVLTVRTRSLRHQVGELGQKVRVLNRVDQFMAQAASRGLLADQWSTYLVHIDDQVSFQALERIVEQCTHSKGLYFRPDSFHVAVGQPADADGRLVQHAAPSGGADGSGEPADVVLGLQGAFLVRH
jgi:hypothetical protein